MYCQQCGREANSKTIYCTNCGARLERPQRSGWGGIALLLIMAGLLSPFLFYWLLDPCGVIPVGRAIRDLEAYAAHLTQIEDATINNARPPSYLLSQIDGDYAVLSETSFSSCTQPSADAMLASLFYASSYFGNLPVNQVGDDGYPIMLQGDDLQNKYDYEAALRDYYKEIETLKACHPLCVFTTTPGEE